MKIKRNKKRTHSELVNIAERWLLARCGFVFKELPTFAMEIPDAIGFRSDCSIMIECKTTFNDFKQDQNKSFRKNSWQGVGDFRYYLCEKEIIQEKDLPDKWGLLWVTEKGIVKVKRGPFGNSWSDKKFKFEKNTQSEISLMYSALRRIHLQGVLPLIYERYRRNV